MLRPPTHPLSPCQAMTAATPRTLLTLLGLVSSEKVEASTRGTLVYTVE